MRKILAFFVSKKWLHQNPWNKHWYFGQAPDYNNQSKVMRICNVCGEGHLCTKTVKEHQ